MTKKTRKTAIKAGAGILTAAALAAAGAYLLRDNKTVKRGGKKAKAWAAKAQKEIVRNMKTASKMGEAEYKHIVDQATKRYGTIHNMNAAEMIAVAQDLKSEWTRIKKNAQTMAKKAAASKKKVAKVSRR